jgi:hypothetical protein
MDNARMLHTTPALVSTALVLSGLTVSPFLPAPPAESSAYTVPPHRPAPLAPATLSPAPPPLPADAPETDAPLSPVLERHAQSSDPDLRRRAIEALESLPAAAALSKLLPFLEDSNDEVRAHAVSALSTQPEDALAEAIIATLSAGAPESWYGWESPLPQLAPKLGSYFMAMLQDAERPPADLAWAAYCLGRMRVPESYDLLVHHLREGATEVAYACVEALYWLDDPRAADEWFRLSTDTDPWVQWMVVSALSRLQSARSLDTLYGFASGQLLSPQSIQELALDGIARFPAADSIPRLIDVLRFNRAMEAQTIDLLIALTGENLGTSATNWITGFEQYNAEMMQAAAEEAMAVEGEVTEVPPSSDLLNTVDFVPPDF